MRSFIKKTLLFLLPVFLLSGLFEAGLRNISNEYSYKKEYLDRNADAIEALILGSSHSYYGLDPEYFTGNTFNAAHIAQPLYFDLELYKKYEESLLNIKTIVVSVSYPTLFFNLEKSPEAWRTSHYVIHYDLKPPVSMAYNFYFLSQRLKENIKKLRSYYLKKNRNVSCSTLGWGTNYKAEKALDLEKSGKEDAKWHTIRNHGFFHENFESLEEIIELSKSRNVEVVIFSPPTYETYRKHLDTLQLGKTFRALNDIQELHSNCVYVDFFDSHLFGKDDFYDSDHMNEHGAKKLSLLINDIIEKKNIGHPLIHSALEN